MRMRRLRLASTSTDVEPFEALLDGCQKASPEPDLDDASTAANSDSSSRRSTCEWDDSPTSPGTPPLRFTEETPAATQRAYLQDLLMKSWGSWYLRDGEDGRERATHFVLYYMIWWIFLPLPWLLDPQDHPLLALSLCAMTVMSNNHWRDVRYGEWRHVTDSIAVAVTFMIHFAVFLIGHDVWTCLRLVLPMAPLAAAALGSFAAAWHRHLRGCVEEGLFFHLLFRSVGTWILVYMQASGSERGPRGWIALIAVHTLSYWMMAWWLWVNAKSLLFKNRMVFGAISR